MSTSPEVLRRAQEYCQRNGLVLGKALGSGVHGSVFAAESQSRSGRSAVKVHEHEAPYRRERDVYLRLKQLQLTEIRGSAIPELLDFHDQFLVLEMTVVTRPFVLDFAGAYLDRPPDFSPEVLADWLTDKQDQFGPRWPDVQAILRTLESYGIYMEDVNPGNISFAD